MKKLYFLLLSLIAGSCAFAQTITNPGMETWRSNASGGSTPIAIMAPDGWYGIDSLVIALGQQYGSIVGIDDTAWQVQLFREPSITHGGTFSAKIMTKRDSFVGNFPGVLSNSEVHITINPFTMMVSPPTYSGGTPVTQRVASVSAWVLYSQGRDSTGSVGADSGSLTVNVYKHITTSGVDSMVGTGTVNIGPSTSFQQVTANVAYTDTLDGADTVRILFASSGQGDPSDSSTLYVDDVTMEYVPNAVKNINALSSKVNVYPNPASGTLYLGAEGNEGAEFRLIAVNGQVVASKTLTGKDELNISALAEGLYFYTITGKDDMVQRGKVSVVK